MVIGCVNGDYSYRVCSRGDVIMVMVSVLLDSVNKGCCYGALTGCVDDSVIWACCQDVLTRNVSRVC